MSIGLCCVSMPTLNKMLVYHLPPYKKLKSWLSSRYTSARSTIENAYRSQPKALGNLFKSSNSNSSRGHHSYTDLENDKGKILRPGAELELQPTGRSVQTLIGTGDTSATKDSGIHLKVKLQQDTRHVERF